MLVLVLNSGSSSIKFQLFRMPEETVEASGLLERIGEERSRLRLTISGEEIGIERAVASHTEGLELILDRLLQSPSSEPREERRIEAVGHRVVHGGEVFAAPVFIDEEVERAIESHFDLAPLHNPANLLGVRAARQRLRDVPQVAVFDTAFHQTMPPRAFRYAIPEELYVRDKVRRYGFHGTSHRYVTSRAAAILGRKTSAVNLISCHLGNGCSMAAVEGGESVDTSMGLTPLEGLVMGTRSGDVDPSLVAYLCRARGMSVLDVESLLNKRSGLLGLSAHSNDLRAILQAMNEGDERAALAVDVYCYRIKKYLGAYTAVLRDLTAVVFTAGVGENAPLIRARALEGMDRLGLFIDHDRNSGAIGVEADIATPKSPVRILVVPTNEELMIARDTYELIGRTYEAGAD